MSPSTPSKPTGIESLPVEVIDQITSYHAGSHPFLKKLRFVRPFHKSASALSCKFIRFNLTPDYPEALQEICRTAFVDNIETLSLELDLSVYGFRKNQWDETTAHATMSSIKRKLKLFPRLKTLNVHCPPRLAWDWCGYGPVARPDLLNSVITAFNLSPPPTLRTLDVRFPEPLELKQPAGEDDDGAATPNPGIASWVANLRSISFRFDQVYKHDDDAMCELLQHGASLETVALTRYKRLSSTPRLLIHHKAPLKCLELREVTMSGESLAYTIASFRRTVTRVVLDDVNLSDGRWEDVLLELSTCQNIVDLELSMPLGYAPEVLSYEDMLELCHELEQRCRVIEDQVEARRVGRSDD